MPVRSLRDGVVKIADAGGTGGANVVTVDLEDGGLSYTERTPVNIIKDRGVLSHARLGEEEPVDLSLAMKFQSLTTHVAIPPYEALKKIGGAAAWVSDEPNSDVYAVIIEIVIDDPAGGADETLTFARFCPEEIAFTEGDEYDTLTVSGRAVITAPAVT
jgi:hypothetical protein